MLGEPGGEITLLIFLYSLNNSILYGAIEAVLEL